MAASSGSAGGATGATGPVTSGATFPWGAGATGATGPRTALMASDLVPPQLALERGYEPHLMSYVTLQPTDSVTPFYGPPNVVDAGVAGVAFVIAVTALLLARRLERHGVRLVMLVVSAALALILG